MKAWLNKHGVLLSLIPVVAVMGLIFWFSAQTGTQSGQMSGKVTRWVLEKTVTDFDARPVEEQAQLLQQTGFWIRKTAHFSEFALLGFCLLLHIHQLRKVMNVRLPLLWAWGIGTLYAATDEFHQCFVGGRGPAVRDVLIDSAGVIAGVMLLYLVIKWKNRQSKGCNFTEGTI